MTIFCAYNAVFGPNGEMKCRNADGNDIPYFQPFLSTGSPSTLPPSLLQCGSKIPESLPVACREFIEGLAWGSWQNLHCVRIVEKDCSGAIHLQFVIENREPEFGGESTG